jgi:hypothetical protein
MKSRNYRPFLMSGLPEIVAFENTGFSDCPIQTAEELAQCKRRYPKE